MKYRLYSDDEGGRKATYQSLRCDFSYNGDDISEVGIFMIHPDFEDVHGNVIVNLDRPVSLSGTARMWILFPEMRNRVHKDRIVVGTKGYMMEGSSKIGEVEVIKIVGLHTNS